ncbi:MAG: YIP1 family protein [Anaerolineae bacterium]
MSSTVVDSHPSLITMLVAIVDQPKRALRAVLEWHGAAVWLIPLLFLLLSSVPLALVQVPYNKELTQQQLQRQLQQLPDEQRKEVAAQMETLTSASVLIASALLGSSFGLLIGLAGQTLWLYLAALIVGGDVGFGRMWRLSVWSRLPYIVNWLAQAGFTMAAGRAVRYPGLSILVATGNLVQDTRNPLFAPLGNLDLFWLWHIALIAFGLSAAQLRRGIVVLLTLSYVVLGLAVQTVPAMLF